jgi:hypothetical protein
MIGANSPNHNVVITGAPVGTSLLDPTSWTTWRTFIGSSGSPKVYGNMVETTDGKAIISYIDGTSAYIAYADTIAGVLAGTDSFGAGTELKASISYAQTSINLVQGKLRMAISYWDTGTSKLVCEYWADSDGTGADLAYVGMIATDLWSESSFEGPASGGILGHIQELTATSWVLNVPYGYYISLAGPGKWFYTLNAGSTWNIGAINSWGGPGNHLNSTGPSILKLTDTSFVAGWEASSGQRWLEYITESGATRTDDTDWGTGWDAIGGDPHSVGFCTFNGEDYMACGDGGGGYNLYRLAADTPDITNIVDYEDWEYITSIASDEVDQPTFLLTDSALILQHSKSDDLISGAGTTTIDIPLRVKRIEINRNRGMASSLTLTLDNKDGLYSPDKAGSDWYNVLFPNVGIYIEQGYGTDLIRTFTGTIDDVKMTTFPHEMVLSCRDGTKAALDKIITAVTYTSKSPEYMFSALATAAGFTSVTTDASGLVIAEKTFTLESYADAFSWLADLAGYIWYCDENGAIYFKDDTVVVGASQYTYHEGQDIVSLGYTISDKDLYAKVVVMGDGVSAETAYISAAYYNIPAAKVQYIQAPECTTEAECQAIADRAELLMRRRDRICEFVAVANPYLQIGDCITVEETSTTISEIYRITDLQFTMSPDGGFLMSITCYHYSAA